MVKLKIAIRIIMNISIAFFSSLWVYFFAISGDIALSVVEKIEPTVMPMPGGAEFYYSPVGRDCFQFSMILLGLTSFFWFFILCNKLWPWKKMQKIKSMEED